MRRWRQIFTRTILAWNDHDATTQGAALAFYTIFSLAPLLILVVALAGAAFGAEAVRGQIVLELQELMGRDSASFVQSMLRTVAKPTANRLAGIIGIATLVFGASGVFVQLQQSLNLVWDVAPRPGAVFATLVRKRMLSFAVVVGIGFLLVVSLILSTLLAALGGYLETRFALPVSWLHMSNIALSFVVVTLLFGLIYKLLPDVAIDWRDVVVGSLVTAALFEIGKNLIGIYLGRSGVGSAYGAAGSLVVITSWVYYSALIFLFGAELTHVYSLDHRARHGAPAAPVEAGATTRTPAAAGAPAVETTAD